MKFYLLTTLFCFFLGASMTSAQNVDLKKSAKLLSSKSAQTQLKAEKQLKASGYDALKHIVPLMYDKNEKVEKRARRIYAWIMFGLNDSIPHESCEQFYRFAKLGIEEKTKLMKQVSELKPIPVYTLAAIHSRELERNPKAHPHVTKYLEKAIDQKKTNLSSFDPRFLKLETQAILLNRICYNCDRDYFYLKSIAEPLQQTYEHWFKLDKSLYKYLNYGIFLEFNRLKKLGKKDEILNLYYELESPHVRAQLRKKSHAYLINAYKGKLHRLNLNQAVAYIELSLITNSSTPNVDDYAVLLKTYPELTSKLSEESKVAEVYRLLKNDQFYAAFALGLNLSKETNDFDRMKMILAAWVKSHPDKLTKGLPKISPKNDKVIKRFLTEMVSLYSSDPVAKSEKQARMLNQLLEKTNAKDREVWEKIIKQNHITLYLWLSGVRGDLGEAIIYLSSKNKENTNILIAGRLLGKKRDWIRQLDAKKIDSETLEVLIAQMWEPKFGYDKLVEIYSLSEQWKKIYPELLKGATFKVTFLLRVYDLWQQREYEDAVKLLVKISEMDKESPLASWFISELMMRTPDLDLLPLLELPQVPSQFVKQIIVHLLGGDGTKMRGEKLIEIWNFYQRMKKNERVNKADQARKMAFKLWREHHGELSYKLMQCAFWDLDEEEFHLSIFPEIALMFGRLSEAIAYAEQRDNDHELDKLRMAYLYQTAGNKKQMKLLLADYPNSQLVYRLAMLDLDEKTVTQSKMKLKKENKLRRRIWLFCAKGDWKKAQTDYAKLKQPTEKLTLLLGDPAARMKEYSSSKGVLVSWELEEKAMDWETIQYNETLLLSSIKKNSPVSCKAMVQYMKYRRFIPKRKMINLIYKLGMQPIGEPHTSFHVDKKLTPNPKPEFYMHKVLAIRELTQLGDIALRDKLIQNTLGDMKSFSKLTWFSQDILFNSIFIHTHYRSNQIIKLLELEMPNKNSTQQFLFLVHAFDAGYLAGVKTMVALTQKHQAHFKKRDLSILYTIFAACIGQPEEKLLVTDLKNLKSKEYPLKPYRNDFSERLGKGEIKMKPSQNVDPHNLDFEMQSGIRKVQQLWNKNKKQEAELLLKEITIVALFRNLEEEQVRVDKKDVSFDLAFRAEVLAPLCFYMLEMPSDLVTPSVETLLRKTNTYDDYAEEKYRWAARLFQHYQEYDKALIYYRYYTGMKTDRTFPDSAESIGHWHALEALCAAQLGDSKKALLHLKKRLNIIPYKQELLSEILNALKEKGDTKTIDAMDAYVTQFWQSKLKHLPNYEPYTEALKTWKALMQ